MTLNQINEKLLSLKESIGVDQKRIKRINRISEEIALLNKELRLVNHSLKQDESELKRLESKSLKSLFTEILGTSEEQIEQERQKYLQQVLRHNSLIEEINSLKKENDILTRNLLDHPAALEAKIKNLLHQKEKLLTGQSPDKKEEIMHFDDRLYQLNFRSKEFEEANREAENLEMAIKQIIDKLKHVKKWGPYKMHGKGRYSSYNKKSFIDKANQDIISGNVALKRFDKELKDLYPEMDVYFSLDIYHQFLEDFYDNLITDWLIQRKLDTTIHSIDTIYKKLNRIQMTLLKDHQKCQKTIGEVTKERESYIMEA